MLNLSPPRLVTVAGTRCACSCANAWDGECVSFAPICVERCRTTIRKIAYRPALVLVVSSSTPITTTVKAKEPLMLKPLQRLSVALVLLLNCAGIYIARGEAPYTEGSVYSVAFIKTKPGMTDEYIKSLAANSKPLIAEEKAEGIVLSYKILLGESANPEDFDLIILIEFKNMGAFDGLREKLDAIDQKLLGADADKKDEQVMIDRAQIREIFGSKLMREITLK